MQLNLLQTKALMLQRRGSVFLKNIKSKYKLMNYLDDSRPSISVTGDKVLYADQSFLKCIALINGS